jgi:fumarate hydratase subunit alpha
MLKRKTIINEISNLCLEANTKLPKDILRAVKSAAENEEGIARDILSDIIKNAEIAGREKIPLCQDTGTGNFFVKLGKKAGICGRDLREIIEIAAVKSYTENYFRKSIVLDPLTRKNTGDNSPSNIYIEYVEGDKIEISFLPKGGGSENASSLKMLNPADGWEGAEKFAIETVKEKGANACPPLIIGLGIGGDFSTVGLLAKKSLLRTINSKNKNPFYAEKEAKLLSEINKLNIGPMGFGGKTTALAVFIETKPINAMNFLSRDRKSVV